MKDARRNWREDEFKKGLFCCIDELDRDWRKVYQRDQSGLGIFVNLVYYLIDEGYRVGHWEVIRSIGAEVLVEDVEVLL